MPKTPDPQAGLAEARHVAADVFVQGFGSVLADVVRRAHPVASNLVLQLGDDSAALAPGLADEGARTVRTSAWIDVSDGPVVLRLPHMHGRYFSLTLIGSSGEILASLGSRTGDDIGRDLVFVGPRWRGELLGETKARRLAGETAWAVGRIVAHSAADRREAEALAARHRLAPLRPDGPSAGPSALRILEQPISASVQQVMEMTPAMFAHRLDQLFERRPTEWPDAGIPELRTRVKVLISLWRAAETDADLGRALSRGFLDAAAAIRAAARFASEPLANGWRVLNAPLPPGDRALAAAARAFTDLGGPAPQDVLSLACARDEAGRDLTGAERYRIHFAPGAAPPVEAFWSLFVSAGGPGGGPGGIRQGISDRNDLSLNPDGSLDLILQHEPPARAQALNWLPAPSGPFTLNMRLHWPKPPALSGAWRMPAVERLGSGFARRAEGREPSADRRPPASSNDLRPVHSDRRCSS